MKTILTLSGNATSRQGFFMQLYFGFIHRLIKFDLNFMFTVINITHLIFLINLKIKKR